jgi:predicted ATP-grasp superfamily ATP-dependent carboligase
VEVQRFVEGPSGETVFVAWKGRVLDAFVIVRECRSPPGTGQSTRIRLIENAEALEQTRKIVEATSFSGFGGIEFVLERANGANDRSSDLTGDEHPVVIEFNPRPLPFTHLGPVFGHDLATALYAQIQSTPYSPSNSPITQSVTLFPQEFLRDPNSPYLYTSYHDVPWDDPQLLSWMLRA